MKAKIIQWMHCYCNPSKYTYNVVWQYWFLTLYSYKHLNSIPLQVKSQQMYQKQTTLQSFKVLEKLGEGSFASVYKVQRIDDNKVYAMKKVQSDVKIYRSKLPKWNRNKETMH